MDIEHATLWLDGIIKDYILNSAENSLKNVNDEKAWSEPLVGFSNGADPLYEAYKSYVGPFHLTPLEFFRKTFHETTVQSDQLSVISWILPHTEATKSDNRKETSYPSERWARARIFGEEVNAKLRKQVVAVLQNNGYAALAPQLSPYCERNVSDRYGFASSWSERHAAYASGLGTFGLCDGLITPKGKAVRCGSVIAKIGTLPTIRPYQNPHEYCLFFSEGKCGKCMKRCPADALTEAGHDKVKCKAYLKPQTADYVKTHYKFDGYGCGLCQTGVPCESGIPTLNDIE